MGKNRIEQMAQRLLDDTPAGKSFKFADINHKYKWGAADTHDVIALLVDSNKVQPSENTKGKKARSYTVRGINWLTIPWR